MNEIKHFRIWANYSTECLLQIPSRLDLLGIVGKIPLQKLTRKKDPMATTQNNIIFVSFYLCYLILSHLEPWCIFWGRYFPFLIIWLKIMVSISSKFSKNLYKNLWSPVIFKEPKFSKILLKILKTFLKDFSLFISVKE